MSSARVLRITSIFIAAFLFGLAWVGIFRIFHGYFSTPEANPPKPAAEQKYISPEAEPIVSIDDPGFTPPQVDENNSEEFDPEGIYTADDLTDPAFSDFELFLINNKKLDVECDAKNFGDLIAPTGLVAESGPLTKASAGRSLKFTNVKISDGKIAFATESLAGTNYKFEGVYLVKGNFYTLDPDARVLSGKLSKFHDGKKVAETEVSFTWSIDLTCVC